MPRLYLVRHGRAEAGFGESMDPGLDEKGQRQAEVAAARLVPLGPLPILTSPLRRTRETAVPLAQLWKREPAVEKAVAEIPSPEGMTLEGRIGWLRELMAGVWSGAAPDLTAWRDSVIAALAARTEDTVIFSHFVAINVAAGAALGDDRVVVFSPDNCSVTVFDVSDGVLTLVEKGHEAELTKVR
jgi:broad specificity phosphatase PhoE